MRTLITLCLMTTAASAAAQTGGWRITPDGYGPVRIGMTRAQAEAALRTPLEGEAIDDAAVCIEMSPTRGHRGVYLMFLNNRLSRVSIGEEGQVRTPRGIGIGATEAQVRRAYPRGLRSEVHEYRALPARYLTFWLRPGRGVRFETGEDRRVNIIHAGNESIQYVEGCA